MKKNQLALFRKANSLYNNNNKTNNKKNQSSHIKLDLNIKLKQFHQLSLTQNTYNQLQLKSSQKSILFQKQFGKSKSLHQKSSNKVLQLTKSYGQIIKTITCEQRRADVINQLINLIKNNISKQNGLTLQEKKVIQKIQSQCNHYQDVWNFNKQNHKKLKELILGQRKTRAVISSKYKQMEKQLLNRQIEFKQIILERQSKNFQLSQLKKSIQIIQNNCHKKCQEYNQMTVSGKNTIDYFKNQKSRNRSQYNQFSKGIFLTNSQNKDYAQSKFVKTYKYLLGDQQFTQTNFLIEKTSLAIQKIQSIIGKPYQQIFSFFDQLIESNNKQHQILQNLNYQIANFQKDLNQKIKLQQRLKFNKQAIQKKVIKTEQQNLLQQLLSLLNLQKSTILNNNEISNHMISEIFYKLDQINKQDQQSSPYLKINVNIQRKISQISSARSSKFIALSPQSIIANMNKFENCQKILNKKQFKDEYYFQKNKTSLKKGKLRNIIQHKK